MGVGSIGGVGGSRYRKDPKSVIAEKIFFSNIWLLGGPTKQGTSHFIIYVNLRKLTYIVLRRTVWYPLCTVVRK